MATICTCGITALGNTGRPGCVYNMAAPAFFILFPRYDENGARNTIDLTQANIGTYISGLVEADSTPFRLYPLPQARNVAPTRTDSVYDTDNAGNKILVKGVGGVYTFAWELWDKDACNAILRELEENGCSDMDFLIVDVNGLLWLRKDSPTATVGYGWKIASTTFEAFRMFASDTTVEKSMVSWDLARYEKVSEGYPITADELGYDPIDTLTGLIQGYQTATALTATTIGVQVYSAFGSAMASGLKGVKGLVTANFKIWNATSATLVTPTGVVETVGGNGEYVVTIVAQTAADDLYSRVSGFAGYDVAESNKTEAL